MRILSHGAVAISLLLTMSACGNAPAQPSLAKITVPSSSNVVAAPSVSVSKTPDKSVSPDSLKTMLLAAGFTCNDLSGSREFACHGTDGSNGTGYLISISADAKGATVSFTLEADLGPKAPPATAAYIGRVLDLISGVSGNMSHVVAAFSDPSIRWQTGEFEVITQSSKATGIVLRGGTPASLHGKIVIGASGFASILTHSGFACSKPNPLVEGGPNQTCTMGTAKVSLTFGQTNTLAQVVLTSSDLSQIDSLVSWLFVTEDSDVVSAWIKAGGASPQTIGSCSLSLSSAKTHTLTVSQKA